MKKTMIVVTTKERLEKKIIEYIGKGYEPIVNLKESITMENVKTKEKVNIYLVPNPPKYLYIRKNGLIFAGSDVHLKHAKTKEILTEKVIED